MAESVRPYISDIRGAARLAVDATTGIAAVVEQMHHTISHVAPPIGPPPQGRPRGITGLVYRGIRKSIGLVGQGIDMGLAQAGQLFPQSGQLPGRDAFLAALNGVYGDYLMRTGNPLAQTMSLRYRGLTLDPSRPADALRVDRHSGAAPRLLILIHGLCCDDRQWLRRGHDHGSELARELGYTPIYLRYNSGLPIADNGQALAGHLQGLTEGWPGSPPELAIIGHSMGGLVARSACYHGQEAGHDWPRRLSRLIFLGTPHHGAPLERGGEWLDLLLQLSPYSAPLARLGQQRSAGIMDLRDGRVAKGRRQWVPLPEGVACYAVAGTLTAGNSRLADSLVGDGLVPVASALGKHADCGRSLAIPASRQWTGFGLGHLDLFDSPAVYQQLRRWLR